MVAGRYTKSKVPGSRLNLATTSRPARATRFSRPTSFTLQRPPVILEWGSWVLRVGYCENHLPKHLIPYRLPEDKKIESGADWYAIVNALLHQCWDRLMSVPSSRRVIVLHPPFMPRAWEAAITQGLWNLGVPAFVFVCNLETPPLALEWQRGMVVHIGKTESHCMCHADGHGLRNTLQIVDCGYQQAVSDPDEVAVEWTKQMDEVWLNEGNPNSLLLAVAKCLQECPKEVRRDIASNIVFCGETVLVVPDLPRRVCERLQVVLKGTAPELEAPPSHLTPFPTNWKELAPLSDIVTAMSTGPYRADMVSWIGASLWASVWHRHDEDESHITWMYAPEKDVVPSS